MDGVEGTRTFQAGGEAYDTYMGRYSRALAPAFADIARITAADRVLDVGCTGGRVAVCVWDFEGGMEMLRAFWDAAVSLDPAAPDELHTIRFGRSGELQALLVDAGLQEVTEPTLMVSSDDADFDELWSSFRLGVGPAGAHVVRQPPDRQATLRAAYFERLGSPTGVFRLAAVARGAVGTVPG